MPADPLPTSNPTEIANRLLSAWSARDLDAFVALLSEDTWWGTLAVMAQRFLALIARRRR